MIAVTVKLLVFIQHFHKGAAGTGKSFLLKTLINGIRFITERRKLSISPSQPSVFVGAPTNNAAFHIEGQTIHSILGKSSSFEHSDFLELFKRCGGVRKKIQRYCQEK